jgi:hypothetical protein
MRQMRVTFVWLWVVVLLIPGGCVRTVTLATADGHAADGHAPDGHAPDGHAPDKRFDLPLVPDGHIADRGITQVVDKAGAGGDQSPGNGDIKVSNLRADWSTPAMVRWTWEASGPRARFKAYMLITGESAADVLSRTGSAVVWTGAQNPELEVYTLPPAGTDPAVSTLTDGHKAATTYLAQLIATDVDGGTTSTLLATTTTAPMPADQLVIFSEVDTPGYSIPDAFTFTTGVDAYLGTHYYEYLSSCPPGEASCWENLRRSEVQLSTAALPAASFDDVFLEFAVACTGATNWWTDVWLRFNNSSGVFWHFKGWTLRCDGEYRLYQIPLPVFDSGTASLQHPEAAGLLYEFMIVGGDWTANSRVRVDEVRLRW